MLETDYDTSEIRINDGDFMSHRVIAGDLSKGLVLLCDHARNTIPASYAQLGLPNSEMKRHIAYDIGAEAVTLGLADRLGVPAIHSCFSRLLIDPNRGIDDPTLIMRLSDGAIVPGNAHIDIDERQHRITHYYQPYHDGITALIENFLAQGIVPLIMTIHSFTQMWKNDTRPWHIGILYNDDARVAAHLLHHLKAMDDLVVGDNEPYSGGLPGETIDVHGWQRGLPNALIEIRQDLIENAAGVTEWVDRLAPIFTELTARPDLHIIKK